MYHYSLMQWLLFFYVYCLFGWCFESTYVSLKQKKFVNRGFLTGPFLPIYGSGAIVVLFTTLPVGSWPVLVYLVGMLSATVLEYITGVLMEAIFKVRYWDYSYQKFNYKGHICLSSSIAWGFFSLGLVYGFHRLVERFVFSFSDQVLTYFTFVVSIVLAVDLALSLRTAFELRDVLVKLEEAKEEFKRLQRRLEIVEAILADEGSRKIEQVKDQVKEQIQATGQHTEQKKQQFLEELEQLREKQAVIREKLRSRLSLDKLRMLRRNPSAISTRYRGMLEEYRNRLQDLSVEEWKEKFKELSLETIREDVKEEIREFKNKRKKK